MLSIVARFDRGQIPQRIRVDEPSLDVNIRREPHPEARSGLHRQHVSPVVSVRGPSLRDLDVERCAG